jgi:hypothetical protein
MNYPFYVSTIVDILECQLLVQLAPIYHPIVYLRDGVQPGMTGVGVQGVW